MLEVKEIVNMNTNVDFINKHYLITQAYRHVNDQIFELCHDSMKNLSFVPTQHKYLMGNIEMLLVLDFITKDLADHLNEKIADMLRDSNKIVRFAPMLCADCGGIEFIVIRNLDFEEGEKNNEKKRRRNKK